LTGEVNCIDRLCIRRAPDMPDPKG
jgi:hypothetical protein